MSLFVAAAAAYGRKGMNVFRLQVKDKKPIQKGGFKTATLDPTTIVKWWGFGQLNNIGIATGLVSGFWVLDIDGAAGDAAIANLEALHGALPDTPEQTTGQRPPVVLRLGSGAPSSQYEQALEANHWRRHRCAR